MLRLLFLVPLACWLLAAENSKVWLRVGAVLAAIATARFVISMGWVLTEGKQSLMLLSTTADFAVLVWVVLANRRTEGRPVRVKLGQVLTSVFCMISVLFALLIVLIMGGERARVPSSDELLPLPGGLVALADRDSGCGGNSSTICLRAFEIESADGSSDVRVAEHVAQHLNETRGWKLRYSESSRGWTMCREEGWPLERHTLCVSVSSREGKVLVYFESSAHN
ncbi:hypothetical protein ACQPW1_24190 [Nocardia sp. CA-128927]|uniref:hypothetical protein n=1 Tax=Nocardia sp. CA-128927 TaxID=3239975 RepID=UPI003D97F7EF